MTASPLDIVDLAHELCADRYPCLAHLAEAQAALLREPREERAA